MPVYAYRCCKCNKSFEEYRSIDDRNTMPDCCGAVERTYTPHRVIADIEPYTTVAADKETKKRVRIGSRREHREFLKRNGYEELGNEKFKRS